MPKVFQANVRSANIGLKVYSRAEYITDDEKMSSRMTRSSTTDDGSSTTDDGDKRIDLWQYLRFVD